MFKLQRGALTGSLQCFAKTNVGYGCDKAILNCELPRTLAILRGPDICLYRALPTWRCSRTIPNGNLCRRPKSAHANLAEAVNACSNYFWPPDRSISQIHAAYHFRQEY
jgi:hypothetical protein